MMTRRFALPLTLGAGLLMFAAPPAAEASVVFSNFGPGLSYDINNGGPVGNGFDGNTYAEGDSFSPSFGGQFQSLQIALSCVFGCPDPITVSLTVDNGNQPGAILESFLVPGASLGPFGTNNAPLLLNSVLHPALAQGSLYWVTVGADLNDVVAWNLNTTGDVSSQAISTDAGATWFSPSGNTPGAMEVDAIPEPASFALFGGGAILVSLLVRRRRSL